MDAGELIHKSIRGHYAAGAAEFEKTGRDFYGQELATHFGLCEAYLRAKKFDAFFDCYKLYEKRLGENEWKHKPRIVYNFAFNRPYGNALAREKLARAYLALGDNLKALEIASQSLAVTGEINPPVIDGWVHWSIEEVLKYESIDLVGVVALANANLGRTDDALNTINRLKAIDTSGVYTGMWDFKKRMWIAKAYYSLKDYPQALGILEDDSGATGYHVLMKSASVLMAINPVFWPAFATDPVGMDLQALQFINEAEKLVFHYDLLLKNDRLEDAEKGYREILEKPSIEGFSSLIYGSYHGLGKIAVKRGNLAAGIDQFKKAIEIIEAQRSSINIEKYKIGFVADKQDVYNDLVGTLVKTGRFAEAFDYAERGKSRALVDLLASKKSFSGLSDPVEIKRLLAELDTLEKESLTLARAEGTEGHRGLAAVQHSIANQAPELASLVTVSTLKNEDVKTLLRDDEALVEYYYQGQGPVYVFAVDKEKVEAFVIDLEGLEGEIQQFRRVIKDLHSQAWTVPASKLYSQLIAPVQKAIQGKRHLTIVPHGAMHYLPFNALRADDGKVLIEKYTLRTLPSVSVLKFLNKEMAASKSLLVLGNPDRNDPTMDLAGAEAEARGISTLWPDAKVIMRKNATESLLKNAGGTFKYLHIASHGQFNPDEPLESRLLLAPDPLNDGDLTVAEIYDLHLNADMVVLSACQTNLGKVRTGDDVIGLTRGFLFAGAKSIVGSLWMVPDEPTKDLMTTFYKELQSHDVRSAMQRAQLTVKAKYNHPQAWAAFQLVGGV